MAKFVLFYSGGGQPETDEESAQVMEAWSHWFDQLGEAVVDAGNPFTSLTKTIGSDGSVYEGAVASVNGYSIITAHSLEEAVSMAQGCPQLHSGGEVSVFETIDIMAKAGTMEPEEESDEDASTEETSTEGKEESDEPVMMAEPEEEADEDTSEESSEDSTEEAVMMNGPEEEVGEEGDEGASDENGDEATDETGSDEPVMINDPEEEGQEEDEEEEPEKMAQL